MNFSDNTVTQARAAQLSAGAEAVLVSEAGLPFQPQLSKDSGIDPFVEWLSLMRLCKCFALCGLCVTRRCRVIIGGFKKSLADI